jgi:hypothetical protein
MTNRVDFSLKFLYGIILDLERAINPGIVSNIINKGDNK